MHARATQADFAGAVETRGMTPVVSAARIRLNLAPGSRFIRVRRSTASTVLTKEDPMAIYRKLQEFLDKNQVEYTHHAHRVAYTAKEVASAENISAHDVAKVVIFLSEHGYGMAVLPADSVVDLEQLRACLGMSRLRLATETEIGELFPDCELGAMPPVGTLFDMPVYVDSTLAGDHKIAFNAGTHRDVVYLQYADYERLVKPSLIHFARKPAMA
jgi:Ala-tRNA(Pro) deacylase